MARPRSEDKRSAILASATELVAAQGLGAPTAKIAKHAGVAEGTLFTYFDNKDDLLNQLYLAIKTDLRDAMMEDYPATQSLAARTRHIWDRYIDWGSAFPAKRKAMSQLGVSDRITDTSKEIGRKAFREIEALVQESLAAGALRDQPPAFTAAIMEALADAVMKFTTQEPDQAERYKQAGFEAFWRAISMT
jgi:AcrR family transcriptional regulator